MRYVFLSLVIIGMMTYSVLDCVRTDDSRIRLGLPHWFWVAVIIILPGAGALTWLIVSAVGRRRYGAGPSGPSARPSRRPDKPLAPDDDPEFLFRLERDRRRRQKEQEAAGAGPADSEPDEEPPPAEEPTNENDDAPAEDDGNDRH